MERRSRNTLIIILLIIRFNTETKRFFISIQNVAKEMHTDARLPRSLALLFS